MKAIVQDRYGPPELLRYAEVERPAPAGGEVLVRVRAAALNHGDRVDLRGNPSIARLALGVRRPRIPILGRAVAGTVEAAGTGVTALRPGDEVFGETVKRGFAEYVAVPATDLAVKPAGLTFEQAATLPVAATTALQALRLAGADGGASRRVLVNGASGGVGTFAVQLAAHFGHEVTAVCSARNAERATALGAARVVDYAREDVTRGTDRFDVVVDLAGGHPLAAMRRVLTAGGVYIASTGNGGPVLGPVPRLLAVLTSAPLRGGRLRVLTNRRSAEDLATLAALVEAGRLTPYVERTRPLSETADALRVLETEHARGKTVLIVA
ncbi:NAD(P)-dependent alcohol dehydrogenase [Dactylosporangium darangshiense]|uniref:NAD(P)-dependent alcohol dehydrogenase n=1 Tax=Dactylosporangium darangshiense TaxID=579108 RepID=A0ABP8DJF8_9ACTN